MKKKENIDNLKPENIKTGQNLLKCLEKVRDFFPKNSNFADCMYIDPAVLSRIINGKSTLTADFAVRAAKVFKQCGLDVRIEYLLGESEYMTESDKISDICSTLQDRDRLVFNLIESMGYKILGEKSDPEVTPFIDNTDPDIMTLHREYKNVRILCGDNNDQIIEKCNAATPTRFYVLKSPEGSLVTLDQEQLQQMIDNIKDYVFAQCELPFIKRDRKLSLI